MSSFSRTGGWARRWRAGDIPAATRNFVLLACALGVIAFALSGVTSIARAKLWLGPQTLVLGSIGLAIGIAIAAAAWRLANASGAELFDRTLVWAPVTRVIVIACLAISLAIARFAFDGFPNSADEYGFLFQAQTFLHGRLWNPQPPDPALFAQNYVIAKDGIWVSQYLPGWPAILALFEFALLPAWVAAPVCGAGLLVLLWMALRLECSSRALTVALLLAYASTGFFLLNGATYFSHCASALMVVGGILCMLRAERSPAWWWPTAAGAFVGLAMLCRIDSGMLAAASAFAAWIEQGCRRRLLFLGLAGAAPFVIAFAAYNWAVTGNPLVLPTTWAGNLTIGAGGLIGTEEQTRLRMLVQTFWRLGELADTASLVVPALYLAALALRIRTRRLRFYDVVPIVNFVLFLIFPDIGGFQMGPRYWFDGFVVMHLTIGSAFSQEQIGWQRFVVACCLLLVPVSLARLPALVRFEAHVMHERSSVFRLAASLPPGRQSVILINDFPSAWNDRFNRTQPNFAKDFVRNGIRLDQTVLYARGDEPNALDRTCALFPDAAVLAFHLDRAHPDGWLETLRCAASVR